MDSSYDKLIVCGINFYKHCETFRDSFSSQMLFRILEFIIQQWITGTNIDLVCSVVYHHISRNTVTTCRWDCSCHSTNQKYKLIPNIDPLSLHHLHLPSLPFITIIHRWYNCICINGAAATNSNAYSIPSIIALCLIYRYENQYSSKLLPCLFIGMLRNDVLPLCTDTARRNMTKTRN